MKATVTSLTVEVYGFGLVTTIHPDEKAAEEYLAEEYGVKPDEDGDWPDPGDEGTEGAEDWQIETVEVEWMSKIQAALLVMLLTPATVNWLEKHDPMALKQAREALKDGLHPKVFYAKCPVCLRFGVDCTGREEKLEREVKP